MRQTRITLDPSRFRAAVFDLDGTLVDSEQAWEKAKRIVSARHGRSPTQAQIDTTIGRSLDVFLREVFEITDPAEALTRRDEIFAEADEWLPQMRVAVPGAAAFLRDLRARGLRIAICSSSGRRHIESAAAFLGIGNDVDLIVSAAELARGKPDPLPYQVTVQRLGIQPDHAIAVEDAVPGAQSAKAAGLFTVAVGWPAMGEDFGFCDVQVPGYDALHLTL